ncbi:Imidazolonepropionase [Polaribacter huanghezhanensis]|uniref:amidohydrolase family protein n=1 Tax=Polaribacter huanghezhanensis TaxID=1354726 RepID=UPI00264964A0|nr:amidohydrolase family protein [Polaribacter huanghezhanensis]WKD86594.1 Imidazolonepropionase [Polaribacter huanghezhanensis]
MKKQLIHSIMLLFLFVGNSFAQQTPAPKQTKAVSIEGATAHLGDGTVIDDSLIMFADGKITFVGSAKMKIARQGTIINAKGKHIYPGFIAVNTTLGLVEINAVKASSDEREIGTMNPHIRSLIAYNTESKVVETMRPNGVLMGQITPRGGRISGTSSIVQFDAWNWEDAAIKVDDGIHMNWPNSITFGRWWLGEDTGAKISKTYPKSIEEIEEYINDAKDYLNGSKSPKNLEFEALKGLFDTSQKLYIHVNGEREITDAVRFAKKYQLNIVIVGGDEASKVASILLKNNIPVVIKRAHLIPGNDDDNYDKSYKTAIQLVEKGITVTIGLGEGHVRMNDRNLPFNAGTFAAYGLDKEEAVKLITLNAAKILGIDDQVGSLAVGKDATLFISKGDALDMRTNIISDAFIQGRKLSLETHQTKLWKRYSNKYKNQ